MNRKRGFTLIELSIVLVIIGLLIGGILVARSMVETAKLQTMINNFRQYEIAVNNFRTTFKGEPGDNDKIQPIGNANNVLDIYGGLCNTADPSVSSMENMHSFAHLSRADMIKGSYVPYSPAACGGAHSADIGDMGGVSVPIFVEDGELAAKVSAAYLTINGKNIPLFFRKDSAVSETLGFLQTYIYTSDAAAIDKKLDDGAGFTGDIVGSTQMGTDPCDNYITEKEACEFSWVINYK